MRRSAALLLATVLVTALTTMQPAQAGKPAKPGPSTKGPSCGAKVTKDDGKPWTCTFADEFDGSSLDAGKWVPQTTASGAPSMAGDCWVDDPANISVASGTLRLTSRREAEPFTCPSPLFGDYTTQYTSGSVSTRGTFDQAFGRWEIRAKFPDATVTGSHSALWLYPTYASYGPWPRSGEIDIAEYYTTYPDRVIPFIHYDEAVDDGSYTNTRCMVADPWTFHTYAMVWTSQRITISIDGATCVDHVIDAADPLTGAAPFDQPFVTYLTQSRGVGPNAFGAGATPQPRTPAIDWVDVWS
jgi:beta-glucanase (GH16 family)